MESVAQPAQSHEPRGAISVRRKSRMDQLITGFVDGILVPVIDAMIPMITNGVAFVAFALIWGAFAYGLLTSQGSLDAAWQWIRALALPIQAVVWVLFLPVV